MPNYNYTGLGMLTTSPYSDVKPIYFKNGEIYLGDYNSNSYSSTNHFLKNVFFKAHTDAEGKAIIDLFKRMGIDTEHHDGSLTMESNNGQRHYYGEYDGYFDAYDLSHIRYMMEKNSDVKILYMPNASNLAIGDYAVHCTSKEIADYLLELVGDKYLRATNEDFDWDRYKDETCYDFIRGIMRPRGYFINEHKPIQIAEEILFDVVDEDLYPDKIPLSELRLNGIYCIMMSDRHSYSDSLVPLPFKFNGSIQRDQTYADTYRELRTENIFSHRPIVVPADVTMRRHLQRTLRERRQQQIAERAQRRREFLEAKNKRKTDPLRYLKRNEDMETKLLSDSLHEILYKFKDNPVAASLLRLNCLGYLGNSIRNITIREEDREMSYCPANCPTLIGKNGNWLKKGRQTGKYGKILRKVIKEQVPNLKFKDQDIEKLVNHLKSEVAEGTFEIVEGNMIRHWYDGERYDGDRDTGTLESSCMRGEDAQDWLDIYCLNQGTVKMLILTKHDLLIGRALIWEDKWMDRIYGSDAIIELFKKKAKENNWNFKNQQSSSCDIEWINPQGEYFEKRIKIHLDTNHDCFPYADTFYHIDVEGGVIANYPLNTGEQMRETDGSLYASNTRYDEIDDFNISSDDAVTLVGRDVVTHYNNATRCAWSSNHVHPDDIVITWDGDSVWDDHDDLVFVESESQYARDNEIFHCEHSHTDYITGMSNSIWIDELDMTVHVDNEIAAYEDNGYHYQDGEWTLQEEGQEV